MFVEENYYGHFDLPFYGKHMVLNALAVISVCYYERMDAKEVAKNLKTFAGAERRFAEEKIGDAIIVDDYAHHPTEVKTVIKAAKQKYPDMKLIAIFKPDRFSRIEYFLKDFKEAFKDADEFEIPDSSLFNEFYM